MNIFDLSSEDYNRFLLLFDPDKETAGEKHELLRRRLVMFFSKKQCNKINGLVDRVFDRIFKMVITGEEIQKIDNLALFIANRHILPESRRESNKQLRITVPIDNDIDGFISENNQEELIKNIIEELEGEKDQNLIHLRFCIDKETKGNIEDKKLILGYYCITDGDKAKAVRKRQTEYFGISDGNLRIKAMRWRDKLKGCIQDCMTKEVS